jgi:2-amino-4-hydroxy-6-hydroxymethyldihydropteridine diphosphokinase
LPEIVYLSLGTNLGDRLGNLQEAVTSLPPQVNVLAQSSVYKTAPWGYTDQPEFLNQVIQAETDLAPGDLITFLKKLETDLGRQPSFRYGPRLIDIDILFYGELVTDGPDLVIPHPRLHERAFVLVPLAEIAPDLRHPKIGKDVRELLEQLDPSGIEQHSSVERRE